MLQRCSFTSSWPLLQCKKLEDKGEFVSLQGEVSEEDEAIDPDWRKLNRKVQLLVTGACYIVVLLKSIACVKL